MAEIPLKMPKMGESVAEATIINWLKKPGDAVEEEETILEVATDKVDSEIPAPCTGVIKEILFSENDVVPIGTIIATIDSEGTATTEKTATKKEEVSEEYPPAKEETVPEVSEVSPEKTDRFYSPLVLSIAQKEKINAEELSTISGSGTGGRVRKSDVFAYLKTRTTPSKTTPPAKSSTYTAPPITFIDGKDRIVEMDRMRQMIADHMVFSKHTSPHVTSYIEVDVTNMADWRNSIKHDFQKKYGEKITFTPIFVDAVAKAIRDFPMINVSVDGKKIIVHKNIHIGIATALPTGNLIVPVVRNADQKSLIGLTREVNSLAQKARENKLSPDEIGGSTFTISNVGTFGSLMGTPIINQPEVAILATGIIKKRPEVLETQNGDVIAIRRMMYLSLSFDHRVVDGFLGGSFLRRIGDYLENFDNDQRF